MRTFFDSKWFSRGMVVWSVGLTIFGFVGYTVAISHLPVRWATAGINSFTVLCGVITARLWAVEIPRTRDKRLKLDAEIRQREDELAEIRAKLGYWG